MRRRFEASIVSAALAALAVLAAAAGPACAEGKKLVLGLPPIFASTMAVVAEREGFFRNHGVEVEVKFFDQPAPRSAALVSGDIDFNLTPTTIAIRQISNAEVDLVALYGMPYGDFVIASSDPARTACKDLKGEHIGVDSIGGARALALQDMLATCGMKLDDVEQVALPGTGNVQAMIAGRIRVSVLHTEEVGIVEAKGGRPVSVVASFDKTRPDRHYLVLIARRDKLEASRDAFTRLVAGLIDATRFMNDPKNADRVVDAVYPIGLTATEAKAALRGYLEIGFWPVDDDGLDRGRLETVIADQAKDGGIKPGKQPVAYDRFVDRSIWKAAAAMRAPGN